MISIISKDEIIKIGQLSNIVFTESDVASLREQLSGVLTYAARVKEVFEGPKQEKITVMNNVTREDVVIKTELAPLLNLIPACEENFIIVPMVLEGI